MQTKRKPKKAMECNFLRKKWNVHRKEQETKK